MTDLGNDEYRIVLQRKRWRPRRFVLHVRYRPSAFGKDGIWFLTPEGYRECIDALWRHYNGDRRLQLGFILKPYVEIPGRRNEFQSNGLAFLEEYDGTRVIYTVAAP